MRDLKIQAVINEMVAKCRTAMQHEDDDRYDTQFCRGRSIAMEEAAQMLTDALDPLDTEHRTALGIRR